MLHHNVGTQREARAMVTEGGLLGRCFGSRRSAPVNIACAGFAALVALGAALMFVGAEGITAQGYWTEISPLMMGILGYLFGRTR